MERLLDGVIGDFDERADLSGDLPGVEGAQFVETHIVVGIVAGGDVRELILRGVCERSFGHKRNRQPMILGIVRGIAIELEVAALLLETGTECADMASRARLSCLNRKTRERGCMRGKKRGAD